MSRPIRKINTLLFFVLAITVTLLLLAAPVNAATTAFLYRPYYGPFPGWNSVVDHDYPDYNANSNGVGIFTKYTGDRWIPPTPVDKSNCTTGVNCYDGHDGIDYVLSYKPVVASAPGTIVYSGWADPNHAKNFGLMIRMDHNNNHRTLYGHLSMVRYVTGDVIPGRWQIGTSGTTGYSSGPHLHFGVEYLQGGFWKIKDPYGWSGSYPDPWTTQSGVVSEWLFVSNPLQPPPTYNGDYVLDNDDAYNPNNFVLGCNAGTGESNCPYWTKVATDSGYWGDLRYTHPNGTTPDYWAKWIAPNLPSTGQYEVEVFIPYYDPNGDVRHRSEATRYQICYNAGCKIVVVDQHAAGITTWTGGIGTWISLGRYDFNAGSSGYIKVTDAAYIGDYSDPATQTKVILVDAVRWRNTH